ncbi:DUF1801 domain-containing protein [Enterococcus plantarum]|uniref:iron chaperone n=1 Tax=Enterococcus plantarum TaxID=1077675 RepID=UPI001A8DB608|nr:DUF1801 domain-containing protein [Enterococcus plantarum]MBO0466014.1 DUF1801 domain-containing protein [Enterococcus plantarum]
MPIIEDYISNALENRQAKLKLLYSTIKQLIPEATEKMSYGMPTFYLNGNLVHFANVRFYPAPTAIKAFKNEVTKFTTSKGAIRFFLDQELPIELIEKIVFFRLKENTKK